MIENLGDLGRGYGKLPRFGQLFRLPTFITQLWGIRGRLWRRVEFAWLFKRLTALRAVRRDE